MSDELVQRGPTALYSASDAGWAEPGVGVPITPTSPLERPVAALRRYKWLALGVLLLAIGTTVALVWSAWVLGVKFEDSEESPP